MAIEHWVGPVAQRTPAGTGAIAVSYPTVPGGILAGDRMYIFGGISIASTTLFTVPAGWASEVGPIRAVTVSPTSRLISKTAVGGESGSVSVASATSSTAQLVMVVVRDSVGIVDSSNFQISTAANAYNLPELDIPNPNSLILVWGACSVASGVWTPPTNPAQFTEELDDNTPIPSMCLQSLLWTGSGLTGVINLVRPASVRGNAIAVAIGSIVEPSDTSKFFQFI